MAKEDERYEALLSLKKSIRIFRSDNADLVRHVIGGIEFSGLGNLERAVTLWWQPQEIVLALFGVDELVRLVELLDFDGKIFPSNVAFIANIADDSDRWTCRQLAKLHLGVGNENLRTKCFEALTSIQSP